MTFSFAGLYGPEAVFDVKKNLLVSTQFEVYQSDGVTPAVLYTDKTKSTVGPNPVTTDTLGNLSFFTAPGDYYIAAVIGGVVQTSLAVTVEPNSSDLSLDAIDATVVHLAGTESITGAKTFSGGLTSSGATTFGTDPTFSGPSGSPVHLSGVESVTGAKTFSALATFTGSIALGSNPATGGATRYGNNSTVKFRNQANSADLQAFWFDTSNNIHIGDSNGPTKVFLDGNDFVQSVSSNSNFLRAWMFDYGTLGSEHRYRKARGTSSALSAVQAPDIVALFDFGAWDGADVGPTDVDGHGYGGGVAELAVKLDQNPTGAGKGQTPGIWSMGTCPKYAMVDPGPRDLFSYDSQGFFGFGRHGSMSKFVDVCGGDLAVASLGAANTPTAAAVGAGVGHTYTYKAVPVGPGGNDGPPSSASNTVTNGVLGAAGRDWLGQTTTATIYNTVDLGGDVPGALYFKILVSVDSGAYQLLTAVSRIHQTYVDDGTDTPQAYTAKTLNPGGRVVASAGVQTATKAGTPADADYYTAPADGSLAVDTSTNRLAYRSSAAWKEAADDSLVLHLAGAENITGSKTLADGVNLVLGTSTGSQIGTGSTQKLGFYGATPIVQPARQGQLTDGSGGTANDSTGIAAIADAATKNAVATLTRKCNQLETLFHNAGLTA